MSVIVDLCLAFLSSSWFMCFYFLQNSCHFGLRWSGRRLDRGYATFLKMKLCPQSLLRFISILILCVFLIWMPPFFTIYTLAGLRCAVCKCKNKWGLSFWKCPSMYVCDVPQDQPAIADHCFKERMKLEAVDPAAPISIRPATVTKVTVFPVSPAVRCFTVVCCFVCFGY